ncbi:mitochondrial import receptor subunit Tom22-domain-containing protein [Catenaria anguillulae PL171]|uniref:Mitochondrial import receptor subunit Tom22-domain-containing protein n=1 Tax=Catenaria anguillulae PL171 TaxID=765915 RepID=A0A1Y2HXJ0_9FUNG|nr:mitochondrial import receptor subunit Tom22-domain-containing protein [Catenaria anguillulae PL171]
MVRLTDVPDHSGSSSDSDAGHYSTDYDSDAESEFSVTDESFIDRLAALADVIPPHVRYSVSSKLASLGSLSKATAFFLGRAAWVLSTTALVMVAPLVYEMEKETHIEILEREQRMREQSTQQLMGGQPGAPGAVVPGAAASPAAVGGIVPPGF